MNRRIVGVVAVILVAGLFGCGSKSGEVRVVPVEVKVVHDGKPVAKAQVALHPETEPGPGVLPARPNGVTDDSGHFKPTSYRPGDGAPEGEYRVTVVLAPILSGAGTDDEVRGPDRFNGRYANPASTPLRVAISRDMPQPVLVELK